MMPLLADAIVQSRLRAQHPEMERLATLLAIPFVRGHWREVTVEGERVLRWIAAFWRGNPRLGVVVKQRNVKAAKGV